MRELNPPFGLTVKVTRHVVLDNGWQYFLTDCANSRPNYSKAIIDTPEDATSKPQYGYVYLPEAEEFGWTESKNLDSVNDMYEHDYEWAKPI